MMQIEVGDMKVTLDPNRAMVTVESPTGSKWDKQGVEVVLYFGILAALIEKDQK